MPNDRRANDRPPPILIPDSRGWPWIPNLTTDDVICVLETGAGKLLLVGGRQLGLLGGSDTGIANRPEVEQLIERWCRDRSRDRHRLSRYDPLLILIQRLARARTRVDVAEALLTHTTEVVGGHQPALVLLDGDGGEAQQGDTRATVEGLEWSLPLSHDLATSLLPQSAAQFNRDDLGVPGGWSAAAHPLFEQMGAVALYAIPIGETAALLVSERRQAGTLEFDDWLALRIVADVAAVVLAHLDGNRPIH